ncbi:OadG family protein [Fervidobacterium thailandense]|uniref:Oxaloacetate decarboxylase, gamma chain n=1 Tax=Fervidobacterium thailandense TaxID=1008305 RepID=A0A1E3G1I1_9BACT|nr:OadG family protein [Fervidobacterium thailandense]ODN30106.1 hypothetical protein A4H02_07330 [Fervidobacterium thailandense]
MTEPNELSITIVGVTTVFAVFVILYIVFKIFEYLGISKGKKVKLPKSEDKGTFVQTVREEPTEKIRKSVDAALLKGTEDEEIAAVIAAVYACLGTGVRIKSVQQVPQRSAVRGVKGLRGWEEWRNYGWRGGNRW